MELGPVAAMMIALRIIEVRWDEASVIPRLP